jgi:3-oxoacyl-[acyl-carrier-protein] synthase-3
MALPIRILGTGRYLPKNCVTAEQVDQRMGFRPGTALRMSGVETRYYAADGETASDMGALAARDALSNCGLKFADIDAIICTSGTPEQPIPSNGPLIQKKLGEGQSGTPAFDVGATCLSFLVGLDVASCMLSAGRYRRVLLVSAEACSQGLHPMEQEVASLIGDGAAAAIVERSSDTTSRFLGARMQTFGDASELTEIRGGGSLLPGYHYTPERHADFTFHMDGPQVYRMASRHMAGLLQTLLTSLETTLSDINLFIPHQASGLAMELMRRKLDVEPERVVNVIAKYGNMISASIPLALDEALRENRLKRGDRVMMLGTSAGFSCAAAVLDF